MNKDEKRMNVSTDEMDKKEDKARVLSESSDDDDDELSTVKAKRSAGDSSAAKMPMIEKSMENRKRDLKPVNPTDIFERDKTETQQPASSSISARLPENRENKGKSTQSEAPSTSKDSQKRKSQRGKHGLEDSFCRPTTSLIEPKKLKLEVPDAPVSTSNSNLDSGKTPTKKGGDVSQRTFEKMHFSNTLNDFKVPAPPPQFLDRPKPENVKHAVVKTPSKTLDQPREEIETGITTKPFLTQESYLKLLEKTKPKHPGYKRVPDGAPDCLQGLSFVISGVLDSLERKECIELIKKHGGCVTKDVSSKTSYIIVGDEPGKTKMRNAVRLKLPQISEDDLLEILRKSNPSGNLPVADSCPQNTVATSKKITAKVEKEPKVNPVAATSTTTTTVITHTSTVDAGMLWVEKYKPETLNRVVGQATGNSSARKLVRWLQNWFKYHGSAGERIKAIRKSVGDPEGRKFKAALLSGPPGIGKTTSAYLAVMEVGYDNFELNASDTRNKAGIHKNVADALSSKSLVVGKKGAGLARKHVLIIDEVDGISGNEDRGGVQELIALIKGSQVPIICICNDRNHQKIRSLANYCYDLRFSKPTFEEMRLFILNICLHEKMKIPTEKVMQLIFSTDYDLRQTLHQLQLFKGCKTVQAYNPEKDLRIGPWDVIQKVFLIAEHMKMSIHDKIELFYQDQNIGPLFVQQNYLKVVPLKADGNKQKHLQLLSETANSLGDGDLVESYIRRTQNWELLPVQAVFHSFLPGEYMKSKQMGNAQFPEWFGKNSNKNKRRGLLQNLHLHLHLQVSGSLEALNLDYLTYMWKAMTRPLIADDHLKAAKFMKDYNLLRDDLESIIDLSLWHGTINPVCRVNTSVKSAFTREVNNEILPYLTVKHMLDECDFMEEEKESVERDAMVKVKASKPGTSKSGGDVTEKSKLSNMKTSKPLKRK